MLREFFQHLVTSADATAKAMGYVREAIAIESRYRRCQGAWQSHLEACRREILSAADSLAPGSHVVIIGSGSLHDVPLEELRTRDFQVSLVDIVHLPAVRKPYQQDEKISFIEVDVTGRAAEVYSHQNQNKGAPPDLALAPPPGLVVSLNILSQLALLPVKCLEKGGSKPEDDFTDTILIQHIDWLEQFECPVLLLSDLKREYIDRGMLLEQEEALSEKVAARLGSPALEWDWHIAPPGEVDRTLEIRHRVGCWKFQTCIKQLS
ncbi:hypothetical protein [Emcibacter sp.]|uniref:hypothetical protein n=1 Tax=Emcibacter sp. TaxID=1979954 RepID=UPI002AA75C99|nr:hypothetical protein [Emcibacter sp.]